MSQQTEKLAILFADISGSTALYDKHGDDLARQLIARCIDTMSKVAHAHQGTLIKTIGDEIMCSFPAAEAAMRAACAMQMAVENSKSEDATPLSIPMHIRIGFNYGEVILEAGDVFGDTVNVAARITAITRARQISVTQSVFDALPPSSQKQLHRIQRAEIKGKQEQLDIFLVEWEPDDMSRTRIGTPTLRKAPEEGGELILQYHDQTFKINEQHKSIVMGRENTCEVVVHSNYASRQHARVELRFGKFIYTDQSMNGTFIRFSDERIASIMRETTILHGSGTISLGQNFNESPTELINFSISPAKN